MRYELPARNDAETPISRYEAFTAMNAVGGGFLSALGDALAKADSQNTNRIMTVWEDEIREVVGIYREQRARWEVRG